MTKEELSFQVDGIEVNLLCYYWPPIERNLLQIHIKNNRRVVTLVLILLSAAVAQELRAHINIRDVS